MLDVRFLGQFEVLLDGKSLTIPTRNAQSLFAYLLLNAGKAHRRERLAGLLWPDSSEENARSNLRHELWRLRKAFAAKADSYFLIDDLTVAFNQNSDYSFDVQRLEKAQPENTPAEDLIEATSTYRGELLPGFYEEWITIERARLAALFEERITLLLDILQSEERWADVVDWASHWIALGEWPEPAYRALITAYANRGDLSKAVTTYGGLAKGLQKELGIKPSEQTQALYKRLKAGWKVDTQGDVPGKRNRQPQRTSLSAGAPKFSIPNLRRSNLPRPLTSFIGRDKEIQEVKKLVARARLVTIIGSGGVGKTRLAIQVGSEMISQYRDGVWWVELASLFEIAPPGKQNRSAKLEKNIEETNTSSYTWPNNPIGVDLVSQAVAKVLRIQEIPGLTFLESVIGEIKDKKLLLILDNCEHLIKACAFLVERILPECPEVTILATSREALKVPGEKAWLLPSLSLPEEELTSDYNSILQSEAVNLFIERTADVQTAYSPGEKDLISVAQICLQLDGIPLAIELAAARMNLLSVQEIAARLDSRFSMLTGGQRTAQPRHQTLRAAIEWSYDLLNEAEQLLFRRLSIFAGSFTLEAAEIICSSEEIPEEEILALLGTLVEKSLLNVEPDIQGIELATRYRFLDTICSFGRLKLHDDTEETLLLHKRHVDYYVHLVEVAEPELLFQKQVVWFRILQSEHENLRAAIEWSVESNQAESALRLVGSLLWFWFSYGSTREGRDLTLKVLTSPSGYPNKKARAKALNTAGFLLCLLDETALARQLLEEALSILRTSDDKASLAWSLQFLGLALAYDKEYDLADQVFKEGLDLTRELDGEYANNFLHFLGDIDMLKGDHSRAKKIYEESVYILQVIGSKSFLAYPQRRLGYLALRENDFPKAWKYFRESLAVNLGVGDKRAVAACLVSLAALSLYLDKPTEAARLYGAVESQLDSLFINLLSLDQAELDNIRNQLRARMDDETFADAFTKGWEMTEEEAIAFAEDVLKRDD